MAFPLFQASPEEAAEKLAEGHDPQWIRSVVSLLDQKLQRSPLERLVTLWNLTGSEAGQLFNVSRQGLRQVARGGPSS